jgi:hypothetical protein
MVATYLGPLQLLANTRRNVRGRVTISSQLGHSQVKHGFESAIGSAMGIGATLCALVVTGQPNALDGAAKHLLEIVL